jgi:hypothetical protein
MVCGLEHLIGLVLKGTWQVPSQPQFVGAEMYCGDWSFTDVWVGSMLAQLSCVVAPF